MNTLTLNMGPIGSPETSVSSHLTPRNNPEDGMIQDTSKLQICFKVRHEQYGGTCFTL
jgi:hypothetical protein